MPVTHPGSVGTLREGPLHAALKSWLARPGDALEQVVDGFVVDLVRPGLLIEVQTANFAAIRPKLEALLPHHRIRLAHPIPAVTWIVRTGEGAPVRRRSPRRGQPLDLFAHLVSFPHLVGHPNFAIDVLMTEQEEHRRREAERGRRRHGWVVTERRLVAVREVVTVEGPSDLAGLLPPGLPDPFSTADLAGALGRPRRLAQQMAYCLRGAGVCEVVGSTGNSRLYRRA